MMHVILLIVLMLSGISDAWSVPQFPELTGRVVDQAEILSPEQKAGLIQQLQQHELKTGNQVVVVTLSSLQDYDISDYGYQLGRHWQIGQKKLNNGILLIVAPNERKVRIETGYGLEGALPDVLGHDIIQSKILPHFRNNDMPAGITSGVQAILQAIAGEYKASDSQQDKSSPSQSMGQEEVIPALFMLVFFGFPMILNLFGRKSSTRFVAPLVSILSGVATWLLTHSLVVAIFIAIFVAMFFLPRGGGRGGYGGGGYWGGGGYSGGYGGGFGGGGFSGGGGSFGGGGASGSW